MSPRYEGKPSSRSVSRSGSRSVGKPSTSPGQSDGFASTSSAGSPEDVMLLTVLLGSKVFAPGFVGFVSDVRFLLDAFPTDQPTPTARLYGLIVSPHARSSSLGYERSGIRSPW